jgi:hypothetical protein
VEGHYFQTSFPLREDLLKHEAGGLLQVFAGPVEDPRAFVIPSELNHAFQTGDKLAAEMDVGKENAPLPESNLEKYD